MLLSIHPDNPQSRLIAQVNQMLHDGGIMIYPTDTLYGLGCSLSQPNAIQRICRLRKLDPKKANLTIVCNSISQVAELTHQLDKPIFKSLKRNLPGPFTYILKSAKALPKALRNRKQTLGFRLIDNPIVQALLDMHEQPLITISFRDDKELLDYPNDPIAIHDNYQHLVDLVIDGGLGGIEPSTIVDCSNGNIEVIREGAGILIEG